MVAETLYALHEEPTAIYAAPGIGSVTRQPARGDMMLDLLMATPLEEPVEIAVDTLAEFQSSTRDGLLEDCYWRWHNTKPSSFPYGGMQGIVLATLPDIVENAIHFVIDSGRAEDDTDARDELFTTLAENLSSKQTVLDDELAELAFTHVTLRSLVGGCVGYITLRKGLEDMRAKGLHDYANALANQRLVLHDEKSAMDWVIPAYSEGREKASLSPFRESLPDMRYYAKEYA